MTAHACECDQTSQLQALLQKWPYQGKQVVAWTMTLQQKAKNCAYFHAYAMRLASG